MREIKFTAKREIKRVLVITDNFDDKSLERTFIRDGRIDFRFLISVRTKLHFYKGDWDAVLIDYGLFGYEPKNYNTIKKYQATGAFVAWCSALDRRVVQADLQGFSDLKPLININILGEFGFLHLQGCLKAQTKEG